MREAPELDLYATAFLDWLGRAARGREEPAARVARETDDRVLALGTAGHVLDYDDTYAPGLAHLSAATAPAALVLAAELGASIGEMLDAYAIGFEAMGTLARASHPALYERGWHPTAVCGVVGAAVTAARLLDAERETAVAIALLRAGGMQAAFGSDGKALQVGMAATNGVLAGRLAAGGASVPVADVAQGRAGFDAMFGGRFSDVDPKCGGGAGRALDQNWIKAWPCCLQTHSSIEAADLARAEGRLEPEAPVNVTVHPISLRAAAHGPNPADSLQANSRSPISSPTRSLMDRRGSRALTASARRSLKWRAGGYP